MLRFQRGIDTVSPTQLSPIAARVATLAAIAGEARIANDPAGPTVVRILVDVCTPISTRHLGHGTLEFVGVSLESVSHVVNHNAAETQAERDRHETNHFETLRSASRRCAPLC